MNSLDHDAWQVAMLGLGGNIGDPQTAMADALQHLDSRHDCRVIEVSRLYRTPPWGKTDQADFFNCCAAVQTRLGPQALLAVCLEIERVMKRVRIERWGPRTIDIDILTYASVTLDADNLTIPHPRMTQRAFVLMPLADFAADLLVDGKRVAAWLDAVDGAGIAVANENRAWWRG